MGNVVSGIKIENERLNKFVERVRDVCRSSKSFKKHIDVDVGHIAWRARVADQSIRNAVDNEKMAALIIYGEICRPNCRIIPPLEIVFDGRFAELTETAFFPIREIKHTNVGFRIVVREGASKHIVVTVHPLAISIEDINKLPEVPNEIW